MKKILFFGLLAFLIAALWQLPLSYAKPHIEKLTKGDIQLGEVSGTIWKGESKNFSVKNTPLGRLNWTVQPLKSLLSLSVKSSFKLDGDNIKANGFVGVFPNKKVTLNNTAFDIDALFINKLQNKAVLDGEIKGDIKHAELHNKNLPIIDGTIDWKEGALKSPIKLPAGDYNAIITPDSGNLRIKLTSTDAPAELNGDIKLNKDWKYDSNIKVKANDKGLNSMLKFTGKPQADGSYAFKNKGDLSPFIGK